MKVWKAYRDVVSGVEGGPERGQSDFPSDGPAGEPKKKGRRAAAMEATSRERPKKGKIGNRLKIVG